MFGAVSLVSASIVHRPLLSSFCLLTLFEVISITLTRILPWMLPLEGADVYSLLAGNLVAVFSLRAVDGCSPSGWRARHVLLVGCVTAWAWRLSFFLVRRTMLGFCDSRLDSIRGSCHGALVWGVVQTLWMFTTLLPVWVGLRAPVNEALLDGVDAWCVVGFMTGWLMEAVADEQRARFIRRRGTTKYGSGGVTNGRGEGEGDGDGGGGKWCGVGLFKVCRFPNYFAEWFMWVCLSVIAFKSTLHWTRYLTPVSPIIVYLILHKASIRLAVAKMRSRLSAEEYSEWIRTPLFFPYLRT